MCNTLPKLRPCWQFCSKRSCKQLQTYLIIMSPKNRKVNVFWTKWRYVQPLTKSTPPWLSERINIPITGQADWIHDGWRHEMMAQYVSRSSMTSMSWVWLGVARLLLRRFFRSWSLSWSILPCRSLSLASLQYQWEIRSSGSGGQSKIPTRNWFIWFRWPACNTNEKLVHLVQVASPKHQQVVHLVQVASLKYQQVVRLVQVA